ncbi:MAG: DUF3857 domain-containing protein [Simkaniaceae bacterium]
MRSTFSLFQTIFLLFFSCVSLNASAEQIAQHSKGAPPSWIKSNDFPVDAIPTKPSQVNLQYLLIDTQRNVEEKTLYCHFAIKALTQSGTEIISQIKIDFDPSFTQIVMHDIHIFRAGKWHDRLENARHNLIQRETELEQNLYNGDLTLVYFLDDIREGDLIEYAYSFVGNSPLTSSHYTDWEYMQRPFTVEKITHRLLADPSLTFSTKLVNIEVDPQIRDLTPSTREWIWKTTETPPYAKERNQPVWYNPPAHIQMSEYKSWEEVVQNILPLYDLPKDFCSSEMQDLIEKWQKSSGDLSKQALFALRFVQDEIRYLGFEDGMGAFQPTDPATTFKRRFGDCKDKTFLLHALLKSMDIHSKMILVHTSRGKTLPGVLPTPFVFNHIVLQLEIGNATYFVDPTWSLQGGSLEKNFFSDYNWGLVLTKNTSALTPLPKPVVENPTEIDSQFTVVKEDLAHLTMKSTFYEANADKLRRSLKWRGAEKISQNCLSRMQDIYGTASLKEVMETSDDRKNNIVTLVESYNLPTRTVQDQKKLDLLSHTLNSYLCSSINPGRSSPYEISYPLWVKERIQIETPYMEWAPFRDNSTKAYEAFFYNSSMEIKKHRACFNFELKHLQDHIPKHALHDCWQMLSEISRRGFPCMTVAASHGSFLDISFLLLTSFPALIIWFPIYFTSRKKRPTQDGLSYYLKKAQIFYMIISTLNLAAIDPKGAPLMIFGVVVFLMSMIHLILVKRSNRLIIAFQAWVLLQTSFTGCFLIVAMPNIHIGHKFIAITIYCLYSATVLAALHGAKKYLAEEKKVAEVASVTSF